MVKSNIMGKKIATGAAKILKSKTASKAERSVAASALRQKSPRVEASEGLTKAFRKIPLPPASETEALKARIAELEAMLHSKIAMLNYLAEAAGYGVGDTFSAEALVKKLQGRRGH